ncbi:MAG TPA: RT0821/Lpp0805 family surface protein [Candidatus Sulfotelmatobacter sp.]|nr:RT0821/Lpp0805 family surface protein [Candidatus Sulfotelmatobacter sp.]
MLRRLIVSLSMLFLTGCAAGVPGVTDRLDPSDLAIIAGTTQATLEKGPVGQSANWTNTTNGHLGTITPFGTFPNGAGLPCRAFQQTVTVDGRTAFAHDVACRNPDGAWFSVNFGSLAGAIQNGSTSPEPYYPYYYGYGPYCPDPFCGSPVIIFHPHHFHHFHH